MRSGTSLRKTWQAVTACLWLLLMAMPAHAAIQTMNIVGVGVHKRNVMAEKIAVEYAKKRAVYLLAEKWKVPDAAARLAKLPPRVFEESVRGVNVLKLARDGDVLYVNTEVSIQDIPLKRALGLTIDETYEEDTDIKRRGVLVLPVFLESDDVSPVVWGKGNQLLEPLKPLLLRHGRGALVLPVGDRADRSELDYDNVLHAKFGTLKRLVDRYGVKEVLQAIVTPGAPETDTPTRILMHRMLPGESRPEMVRIAVKASDSMKKRMAAAADAIARYASNISTATAEEERDGWEKLPKQRVRINFTTMQEFGNMQRTLEAAPGVKKLELSDIELQRVEGVLYTAVSQKKLAEYFDKQGVRWQQIDGTWVVSYR